jgi:hypothetical protein
LIFYSPFDLRGALLLAQLSWERAEMTVMMKGVIKATSQKMKVLSLQLFTAVVEKSV